jgi:nitrite reductase (NO-forming)
MRDRPGVLWLGLAVVVALVHPFVPESRWLMVHLVMLGAATHSVMVWSTHFAQALLKTPEALDDRRAQTIRLATLLAGTSAVLVGVPTGWWPLVVLGAALVAGAVVRHAVALLRRLRHALPGRFRITVRYYLAAAVALVAGATFGTLLARGPGEEQHARLLLAHSLVMVLGWLGLTVTGTLVTLWPTMLRTAVHPAAERTASRALPPLVVALSTAVVGALIGEPPVLVIGLVGYAVAVVGWAAPLARPAVTAPPRQFSGWSVLAGMTWLVVGVGVLAVRAATEPLADLAAGYGAVTAILVAGFLLQVLSGALGYLVPTVVGGGSHVVRAGRAVLERWAAARVLVVNVGLALCLLPVPSVVRVAVSVLVLIALASFIPLLLVAVRSMVRERVARSAERSAGRTRPPLPPEPSSWRPHEALAGALALALAVTVGVALDPASAGLGGAATQARPGSAVTPTGEVTRVSVRAVDMAYEPARIEVPSGDRLVIELTNADPTTAHDLTLGGGLGTARLRPGESAVLDVGVVGESVQAWCSVVGHRGMGMVLDIVVTGAAGAGGGAGIQTDTPVAIGSGPVEQVVDATLPPLTDDRVRRHTFTVTEADLEVAPGVRQTRWTFGGGVPGPTLHGRVGDVFEITLVNDGTIGHSIDFHAGALAPDEPMRTIAPGESLVYRFTATRAGIWMYHCSTMPMSAHISAGMHGAVVIEPADLPPVDRSYLLVQSEVYLAGPGTGADVREVDAEAVRAERPDAVVFNGVAAQYDHEPLEARVGERIRVWVLDAGPNRPSSFHVVGGQFDTVYSEGAWLLGEPGRPRGDGGSQVLALAPAQGGFVELVLPEEGNYPFVSHLMVDAERGAHGVIRVTG